MMKEIVLKLVAIFVFISITSFCLQESSKSKVLKGEIATSFHLSSTNKIELKERPSFEKELEVYIPKMKVLTKYFELQNQGKENEAKKVLKKDKFLSKKEPFELAYMYTLIRYKEMGVLYQPCFQIHDKSEVRKLIFCTEEQLKTIKEKGRREVEVECTYIGKLNMDNVEVYKLN